MGHPLVFFDLPLGTKEFFYNSHYFNFNSQNYVWLTHIALAYIISCSAYMRWLD